MPDNSAGKFIETLSNGDKAILGGSLVVLIAMFLPWYGVDLGTFGSESVSGFHSWGLLTFIAWLFVVVLWLLRGPLSSQFKMPEVSVTDGILFMIGGGVEALGALIFWLAYKTDVSGFGISAGVKFGTFVALVGGLITAAGGYLKQSEPAAAGPVSSGMGSTPPPPSYGAPPPPATPPTSTPPPTGPPAAG
jgi:hypothetical protein